MVLDDNALKNKKNILKLLPYFFSPFFAILGCIFSVAEYAENRQPKYMQSKRYVIWYYDA
uniref:Uncharacterized protein n=1 Tax=viral metagenome TaxID=1070528 RepID=A0A6C0BZ83_9ZZZZ